MNDTELRFARAIADAIGAERIAELHLFASRKQGGMETGVAVVAASSDVPAVVGEAAGPGAGEPATGAESIVVYSAHYRLVLKGPDRGKWESEVTAEADAPLVTVDEVVRGVQRRGGDGYEEPQRVTGDRLRELLALA